MTRAHPNAIAYWNQRADVYDTAPWVHDSDLMRWTVNSIQNGARRPATVLDIGCGTGALTFALADEFFDADVYGTDTSVAMIDRAVTAAKVKLGRRSVSRVRFAPTLDAVVDYRGTPWGLVTARSVLHHAPSMLGWRGQLDEWAQLITIPGASLAIVEGVPPDDAYGREFFHTMMQVKEPGRWTFLGAEVADHMLRAHGWHVSLFERFTQENSCKRWLDACGLDVRVKLEVLDMHIAAAEANAAIAKTYDMILTLPTISATRRSEWDERPDVIMRWRHAVIVGTKVV